MANIPKKVSVGNRTVVGDQVINAGDRLVEREQLNRILQGLKAQIAALEARIDALPDTGGGGEEGGFELSVDPSQMALTNVEGDSYYLNIIAGGIGTTELADLAVTGDKIDFSTFDTDDVVEGATNLYFTDERAQDAVGTILDNSTFVDLAYDDGTPAITASLSATGTPDSSTFLRGDNTWAAAGSIDYDDIEADESLADGDFVNVFDDAGTPKVRLAKADSCDTCAKGHVRAAWTAGQMARVYRPSTVNSSLSGLTPGLFYYLDAAVAGGVVDTPDMTDGYIIQNVGWAISATELVTNYQEPETVGFAP